MTPQERAKELIDKFSLNPEQPFYILSQNHIKQCALIAVEELIEEVRYLDDDSQDFWEEVKHEIEKL